MSTDKPSGSAQLEAYIRHIVSDENRKATTPLPTTRELGRQFSISHATAYRVLWRLADAGLLWRRDNGRFYPPSSRQLYEQKPPLTCLLRQLESWSVLYRSIMEGVSAACGERRQAMLLWHNETLVQQARAVSAPRFGKASEQIAFLQRILDREKNGNGGYILDHLWQDEALVPFAKQLQQAVLLYRPTQLPFLNNVVVDFHSGALHAIGHLLACGYEHIHLVKPFSGDSTVDLQLAALATAIVEIGAQQQFAGMVECDNAKKRDALLLQLKDERRKVALYCPEDNTSRLLYQQLRKLNPAIGLLSGMGTAEVTTLGITSVQYDFNQLGKTAVDLSTRKPPTVVTIPARLQIGVSTQLVTS